MSEIGINPEIGVFDSGVGGLSVLRELHALLPEVRLHYVADTAFAPYGARSPAEIQDRSERISEHLLATGARLIVVACNTATAHAIDALRLRWPGVPFVGTEPGIKPAVAATRNGRIGVVTTVATAGSARYRALVAKHAEGIQVVTQPCPGVVDLIETGRLDSPELAALVDRHCAPLRAAGVDTVLLGCTHYPFIEPLWRAALGPDVQLLRIETAVARRAASLWSGAAEHGIAGLPSLETSGSTAQLALWVHDVLGWTDAAVSRWSPESETASSR